VHGRERRQAEAPADFFQTRGIAVLADELGEVIEDFPLPLREWKNLSLARL